MLTRKEGMKMKRTPIIDAGAVDTQGNGHYSLAASTAGGENFLLCHSFDSEEDVEALAVKVREVGSIDEDLWVFWRTTYGSAAYEAEEAEAALYASSIRSGVCSEDDPNIPDNIRVLL
jgi:hypothetical protein|tara:strand:+ start:129 stop:482 length:354 start_codon:yes stop_codon:yes gene_type:complete